MGRPMRLSVDSEAAGWNRTMNGGSLEMNESSGGRQFSSNWKAITEDSIKGKSALSQRDCNPGMPTNDLSIPWGLRSAACGKQGAYERGAGEATRSKATTESDGLRDQGSRVMPVEGVAHGGATCLGQQQPDTEMGGMLETKLNRIAEKARRGTDAKATL